jgi:hypothetical protein
LVGVPTITYDRVDSKLPFVITAPIKLELAQMWSLKRSAWYENLEADQGGLIPSADASN